MNTPLLLHLIQHHPVHFITLGSYGTILSSFLLIVGQNPAAIPLISLIERSLIWWNVWHSTTLYLGVLLCWSVCKSISNSYVYLTSPLQRANWTRGTGWADRDQSETRRSFSSDNTIARTRVDELRRATRRRRTTTVIKRTKELSQYWSSLCLLASFP